MGIAINKNNKPKNFQGTPKMGSKTQPNILLNWSTSSTTMNLTDQLDTISIKNKHIDITIIDTITTMVEFSTASLVGQVVFSINSLLLSLINCIIRFIFSLSQMASQVGLEPTTDGVGVRYSTNWSYWPLPLSNKLKIIKCINKYIKSKIKIFFCNCLIFNE